jgi:hypothetical protein
MCTENNHGADFIGPPPEGLLCRGRQTGYGGADNIYVTMHPTRHLPFAIAVMATCLAAAPTDQQPQRRAAVITCTNPSSGATWQISIDYDRATVDSNAAQLSDTTITWREGKVGGNYTLDLRSGELTVIVASSTGGFFLRDHCGLPP